MKGFYRGSMGNIYVTESQPLEIYTLELHGPASSAVVCDMVSHAMRPESQQRNFKKERK